MVTLAVGKARGMNTSYDEKRLHSLAKGRVGFGGRGKNSLPRDAAKTDHLRGIFGNSNSEPLGHPTTRHKSKNWRDNINDAATPYNREMRARFRAHLTLYARLVVTIGLVGLTTILVLRSGGGTDAAAKGGLTSSRSKPWPRTITSSEIPAPVIWAPDRPPRTVRLNSTHLVSANVNDENTFAKGPTGMSTPQDTVAIHLQQRASTQPPMSPPPAASKPSAPTKGHTALRLPAAKPKIADVAVEAPSPQLDVAPEMPQHYNIRDEFIVGRVVDVLFKGSQQSNPNP